MYEPGPWQERLLVFVLLCAMVLYLAKVAFDFRTSNLTLRRNLDIDNLSETSDTSESSHSD
jgi:hypothetical protein